MNRLAIAHGEAKGRLTQTISGITSGLGGGWIVRAGAGQSVTVRVVAQKGGTATQTVRCE